MSDIVEDYEKTNCLTSKYTIARMLEKAIREIEALRAENARLREATLEEAAQEIERVGHSDYPNKLITDGYAFAVRSLKTRHRPRGDGRDGMIREYLMMEWLWLSLTAEYIDDDFDAWVNSLTNIELVQYIDNALAPDATGERVMSEDILDTMREYAQYAETSSEKKAFEDIIAEITRLREAGKEVVEWWLRDGMNKFDGAPGAMFNLRAAIGYE